MTTPSTRLTEPLNDPTNNATAQFPAGMHEGCPWVAIDHTHGVTIPQRLLEPLRDVSISFALGIRHLAESPHEPHTAA